jgi:hypothetical protein
MATVLEHRQPGAIFCAGVVALAALCMLTLSTQSIPKSISLALLAERKQGAITILATPRGSLLSQKSSDEDILDSKQDLDNGVVKELEAASAKVLATSFVDKVKLSDSPAVLADENQEDQDEDKNQAEHQSSTIQARKDWSKTHPDEDAEVVALKKQLWPQQAADSSGAQVHANGQLSLSYDNKKQADQYVDEEKKKLAEHNSALIRARQDWSAQHPERVVWAVHVPRANNVAGAEIQALAAYSERRELLRGYSLNRA